VLLDWVITFFGMAAIAGILGFKDEIAIFLCFVFSILFMISLIVRLFIGRKPPK